MAYLPAQTNLNVQVDRLEAFTTLHEGPLCMYACCHDMSPFTLTHSYHRNPCRGSTTKNHQTTTTLLENSFSASEFVGYLPPLCVHNSVHIAIKSTGKCPESVNISSFAINLQYSINIVNTKELYAISDHIRNRTQPAIQIHTQFQPLTDNFKQCSAKQENSS
jgi:hypothetical protein